MRPYSRQLDENEHEHVEALDSSYHEAQRVMSPRGLDNYLQGMRAMCTLNRGQDLVLTYVQEIPGVAKEVGEDVVPDIVEAMMKLASRAPITSPSALGSDCPKAIARARRRKHRRVEDVGAPAERPGVRQAIRLPVSSLRPPA